MMIEEASRKAGDHGGDLEDTYVTEAGQFVRLRRQFVTEDGV